jgi:PAN domain
MGIERGRRQAAGGVSHLVRARNGRRRNPRVYACLAVAAVGVVLFGCAECPYDDPVPTTVSISRPARPAAARSAARKAVPDRARQAAASPPKQETRTAAAEQAQTLKPQNNARFVVLENVEAVGRSRSFTGGQSDPNACAEQCLANSGCDAFSFERETKLCFLVSQVTELSANASFVSGRLR